MTLAFWLLAVITVAGALAVVFAHGMTRMVLGLGAFLLGVAGLFLLYGMSFLAVAQVFVYVGGVLVLFLFAIMGVTRDTKGRPDLANRHDLTAAVISIGLFMLMQMSLQGTSPSPEDVARPADAMAALSDTLLGGMLAHFELLGAILLIALVTVIAIMSGKGSE